MAHDLLTGKICIVTGGTQGLGKGIALHLAEKGAAGVVICGRNVSNGEASAKEIQDRGCACHYVQADLTQEADCRNVVRKCDEHFGRVHGLVNAAGITDRGSLEDTTVAAWDVMFHTNVRAPFILTQEAVRIMRREQIGGSIVNIISDTSHGGPPYLMAYSTTKGALATLTKNNAHALRFDNIRVNGINMGWTLTPHEDQIQKALAGENWLADAEAQQPFGRLLRPYDIAGLVGYLLSDQAEMVTGSVIDFNQNVIGAWD
jgi:NAD(P)-dependent dehydrogenase (short-subunit alcohol dehydrogenase family)